MALEHDLDSGLALAVRKAGSQTNFGEIVGKRQSTVNSWLQRNAELPAELVLLVERELAISRHDLRPDLYPSEEVSPAKSSNASEGLAA